MNEALKITLIAIVCIVVLLFLKKDNGIFAFVAELSVVLLIVLLVLPYINDFLAVLESLKNITNSSGTAIRIMLKAFTILTLGAVTADICRDNSAGAVAGVVEMSVKILAISCAIPVFTAVLEIATAIFNR